MQNKKQYRCDRLTTHELNNTTIIYLNIRWAHPRYYQVNICTGMLESNPKPSRCIRITFFSLFKMLFIMIVNICWYFFDIFLSASVSTRFSRWMRCCLSKLRKYESLQFFFGSLPNNGNNTQLLLSLLLYAHLSFVRKKEKNGLPVLKNNIFTQWFLNIAQHSPLHLWFMNLHNFHSMEKFSSQNNL